MVAEVLTAVVFALVLWARVLAPDAWGTEKPADLMLLNAVHTASDFPPHDPWLSGERLSYYFLGHVQMDVVGRLSGQAPEFVFNLATATVGGLVAAAVVGLAVDLVQLGGPQRRRVTVVAGALAGCAMLLVSPLVGLVQIASGNGLGGDGVWGWLGLSSVPAKPEAVTFVPEQFWWWWPTTRVVPGVISVPHGWGHDREGVQLGVARRVAGQSVNDIIGSNRVEAVTAMAQLNGIPVKVEPAKAAKRRKKAG